MTQSLILVATAVVAVAGQTNMALGQIVELDFDSLSEGPLAETAFDDLIGFDGISSNGVVTVSESQFAVSGAQVLGAVVDEFVNEEFTGFFLFEFSTVITQFGVTGIDIGGNGFAVIAFNGDDTIEQFSTVGVGVGTGNNAAVNLESDEGFTSVLVQQVTPDAERDGYIIDDVSFTFIPTPPMGVLFVLAGCSAVRRSRYCPSAPVI